jgi:hypothetical protein
MLCVVAIAEDLDTSSKKPLEVLWHCLPAGDPQRRPPCLKWKPGLGRGTPCLSSAPCRESCLQWSRALWLLQECELLKGVGKALAELGFNLQDNLGFTCD